MSRFPYQDPALSVDARVEDLLSRLELADKAGLLYQQYDPLFRFGHGLRYAAGKDTPQGN